MINFEIKGAIFDVDDTLLDNRSDKTGFNLHDQSRLEAVREAGVRHGIRKLEELSPQDSAEAFLSAPVHTAEAAMWSVLRMKGIADSEAVNMDDPLLQEMVMLKNERYKVLLATEAREVPGATRFVRALADNGLRDKLAIASTAARADIDVFLGKTGLDLMFPNDRIKSKESVKHAKPNPEVFNLAFATLGLPEPDRSAVCVFEDDPRGIMAARSAGLYVCAITTRFDRASLLALEVPPHIVADSYEEFTEVFGL